MEQYHGRKLRKSSGSGGGVKPSMGSRKRETGGHFTATKVGDSDLRVMRRTRGGNTRISLKKAAYVNVATKEGVRKVKIRNVTKSPANKHYARQNIVSKGSILDTEIGKVRVTNRVGQEGVVNGVPL